MTERSPDTGTRVLLERMRSGDPQAQADFFGLVYEELRSIAGRKMAGRDAAHTLGPTALVHECYMRMVRHPSDWNDRKHFVATAACAMRSILVDHARRKRAAKRPDSRSRVALDSIVAAYEDRSLDLVALHEAIELLSAQSANLAQLVELRFFAGLSISECAEVLEISEREAYRRLRLARAFLHSKLGEAAGDVA
ncbi:MAG: sigma-70 family RNA polymerase sigma factor [Planctomycetes bacterium]|nr:sigma-70 family RNA polymerase sigma factor [Planctomycetota bacterium]